MTNKPLPPVCSVCGKPLEWISGRARCPSLDPSHTSSPTCTRKQFRSMQKAVTLASLPCAYRLPHIGGWRLTDRTGVFLYSTLTDAKPGAVRARINGGDIVRWFCPDAEREKDIVDAGYVKRDFFTSY